MPLYEYQCVKCKRRTEKIEKVDGPHLRKCPHCGGKVERMTSAPAIQFKGSGWYVTDYASKKSAGTDGSSSDKDSSSQKSESKNSDNKDSAGKESSSKESKDSKESKASKESSKESGKEKKSPRKKD